MFYHHLPALPLDMFKEKNGKEHLAVFLALCGIREVSESPRCLRVISFAVISCDATICRTVLAGIS